jgi:GT2 family glycosyltransferase
VAGARPHIAVVIPNWNGLEHLEVCLRSVLNQSAMPDEVVLVDNGSSDGSVEFMERTFPTVRCIRMGTNTGFAVAVNRGIRETQAELVVLLNNDTEVDRRWIEELTVALEADAAAGMATCKMLRFDRRDVIDGAGDALTRAGSPYTRGSGEPDGPAFNTREYVFGACGGASVYRRTMLDAIGLFDEEFISYYEDVDLSLRARLAGWQCLYVPAARCYHKRGATSARRPAYPIRMQERNLTSLYVKNYPAGVLLMRGPVILASRARRTFRAVIAGIGAATIQGMWEGMRLLPSMLRKRKAVQRLRRVDNAEFTAWMGR